MQNQIFSPLSKSLHSGLAFHHFLHIQVLKTQILLSLTSPDCIKMLFSHAFFWLLLWAGWLPLIESNGPCCAKQTQCVNPNDLVLIFLVRSLDSQGHYTSTWKKWWLWSNCTNLHADQGLCWAHKKPKTTFSCHKACMIKESIIGTHSPLVAWGRGITDESLAETHYNWHHDCSCAVRDYYSHEQIYNLWTKIAVHFLLWNTTNTDSAIIKTTSGPGKHH